MKVCKNCLENKPLSDYGKNNRTKDRHANLCRPCDSERVKAWQEANSEKYRESLKKRRYSRHGISLDQYQSMLDKYGERCWSCKTEYEESKLKIDHDHSCCNTNYSCGNCVRGLLCTRCNLLAGLLEANPSAIRDVSNYLNSSN